MNFWHFQTDSLWISVLSFAVAAVLVWTAGTRLTIYLDQIAEAAGMQQAFVGMLLLGGITSLPEIASVGTASVSGNASLAVNNLLGSVSANVLLIALADVVLGRDALTSVVPGPATIMQGALGILILILVAIAILSGDITLGWIGLWPAFLCVACIGAFWMSARYASNTSWRASDRHEASREIDRTVEDDAQQGRSLLGLTGKTLLVAAAILVGGFVLARSGEAIAEQTGMGSGLTGLVLMAFATSLPEVSTITAAIRRGHYEMALGDIFGTNILTVSLIFLADLLYQKGPVLAEAGRFEAVAALLGAVLTGIFLIGLLERANRTIWRMGFDAAAALAIYPACLLLLYRLQE